MYTLAVIVVGVLLGWGAWHFGLFSKFSSNTPPATTDTTQTQTPTLQTYTSPTAGFSISYPNDFALNTAYAYSGFGEKKLIHGVSLTVPGSMATGTNLGSDTYVSVEQLPNAKKCTADIFIVDDVKASTMQEGSTTYSVATTSGAGAGNRYEESVYAIADSKPCTAVRYFVHYSVFENYPAGTVTEFNRAELLSSFDAIRRSLALKAQ
jgi:hypothetical protein